MAIHSLPCVTYGPIDSRKGTIPAIITLATTLPVPRTPAMESCDAPAAVAPSEESLAKHGAFQAKAFDGTISRRRRKIPVVRCLMKGFQLNEDVSCGGSNTKEFRQPMRRGMMT